MFACRNYSDETKYMSFWIKDDELLQNYNEIWERVSESINKKKKLLVNLYMMKNT